MHHTMHYRKQTAMCDISGTAYFLSTLCYCKNVLLLCVCLSVSIKTAQRIQLHVVLAQWLYARLILHCFGRKFGYLSYDGRLVFSLSKTLDFEKFGHGTQNVAIVVTTVASSSHLVTSTFVVNTTGGTQLAARFRLYQLRLGCDFRMFYSVSRITTELFLRQCMQFSHPGLCMPMPLHVLSRICVLCASLLLGL